MATNQTPKQSFRLSAEDSATIETLSHMWGPIAPLTRTAVIREALRRALLGMTEDGGKKKPAKS